MATRKPRTQGKTNCQRHLRTGSKRDSPKSSIFAAHTFNLNLKKVQRALGSHSHQPARSLGNVEDLFTCCVSRKSCKQPPVLGVVTRATAGSNGRPLPGKQGTAESLLSPCSIAFPRAFFPVNTISGHGYDKIMQWQKPPDNGKQWHKDNWMFELDTFSSGICSICCAGVFSCLILAPSVRSVMTRGS